MILRVPTKRAILSFSSWAESETPSVYTQGQDGHEEGLFQDHHGLQSLSTQSQQEKKKQEKMTKKNSMDGGGLIFFFYVVYVSPVGS